MKDNIRLFALGGLDEHGKNLFVVELNDDIYIIDAGIKYPDKHTPGVDIIIPDFKYLVENASKVKGYIISHGHDDQMGAIPYLYQRIKAPIYCSKTTKLFLEKKTKDYGLKIDYDYVLVKPNQHVMINDREFIFISMTHSLPESLAIAINTSEGYIVYTSDFIVDYGAPLNHQMDLALLAKIAEKGVYMLLSESCSATKQGHTSPNHRLTPKIQSLFNDQKGRIFISLYSQNAFNQKEVLDLAIKNNKKVLYLNHADLDLISKIEYNNSQELNNVLLKFDEINRVSEQDLIIVITGNGEDLFNTLNELSTGIYQAKNIEFKDTDTFVVASPSVSGTEIISIQAIDNLYKTGAKIINLTRKDIISMHAQEEDLKMMLFLLKPKYYFPVKGDYVSLMANAKIALSMPNFKHTNIFVFDNGMKLTINNGVCKPDFSSLIHVGDLMVDTNVIGSIKNEIIDERQKLARDGIIVIASTVSKANKCVVAGPDVQMRGFIFLKDSEDIVKQILALFNQQVDVYLTSYYGDKEELIEKIKDRISKYVRKETGKNPLVLPNIIDVD